MFYNSHLLTLDSSEKYMSTRVDYQQELLDFSKEKLKENIKDKININTATINDLMELPAIGEKLARVIIDYRNKKGAFKSINDLLKVKGIGKSKLEKIKNRITIK